MLHHETILAVMYVLLRKASDEGLASLCECLQQSMQADSRETLLGVDGADGAWRAYPIHRQALIHVLTHWLNDTAFSLEHAVQRAQSNLDNLDQAGRRLWQHISDLLRAIDAACPPEVAASLAWYMLDKDRAPSKQVFDTHLRVACERYLVWSNSAMLKLDRQ